MSTIHHDQCPVCSSSNIQNLNIITDHSHTKESFQLAKCGDCGFHFTQNAPDAPSIGRYYQSENYVSHSDTQKGLFFKLYHLVRDYMLKRKQQLVSKESGKSNGNLLDIGTGTGYFLNQMKSNGWKVEGIEQDESTRNYAIQKFDLKIQGTDQLFELQDTTFDVVTMWHVLEHVHELKGYLTKIHSLLKADGLFVVAVPNHQSFDAKYYKEFWAAWDIPIHLWHFNPLTMSTLMSSVGFKVEKVLPMPFDAVYVSMLSEQYRSGSKWKGLLKGIQFALKGKSNPKECSSVIYVIRKNA